MTTATVAGATRLTGIAPQFLVDDLDTAIAYYQRKLGFELDFCYESFYASVSRDGFAIHLKCAPKTSADRAHRKQEEHPDAYIGVIGAAALHEELRSRGALIIKPLEERPWSCRDFYVEDPDGYLLCFSEPTARTDAEEIELLRDVRTAVKQIDDGERLTSREAKAELRRRLNR